MFDSFEHTSTYLNEVIVEMLSGSCPLRLLFARLSVVRLAIPKTDGTEPFYKLLEIIMIKKERGRGVVLVPVKELPEMSTAVSSVRFTSGNWPVKEFDVRYKACRLTSCPNVSGIVPVNRRFAT